jgi:hypothetical protein
MACRHDRVRASLSDEAHADVDAGIALPSDRSRRLFIRLDVLGGVDEFEVRRLPPRQQPVQPCGVADEDEVGARIGDGPGEAALDDLHGGVIATHGIDRDSDPPAEARFEVVADRRDVHALRRRAR